MGAVGRPFGVDKPLLANDPHPRARFPGTWYLARLVGPGFDIRGATSPGSPAVVLGHNGTIGWGFTTTNSTARTCFIERVDPTDPNRYITPDGPAPVHRTRGDDQRALGRADHHARARDAARPGDRRLHPRTSNEDLTPQGPRARPAGDGADGADTSAEGFGRLGLAQNWKSSRPPPGASSRRCRTWSTATPPGTSAWCRRPRADPPQGRRLGPVAGWTGEYDWAGFVPFDDLPRVYNPRAASSSTPTAAGADDYRHFITRDWADPYRQRRANQLLREVERHPVYGMIAIQADNLTLDAAEILPLLLKPEPRNARAAKVREHDGRAGTASCWRAGPSR
jgi:penicillin amidase